MVSRRMSIAVLMLLLSGCTAAAGGPARNDPSVPPLSEEAQNLILPFDAYEVARDEYYIITDAQDIIVRDCMHDRGYEWDVIDRPTTVPKTKNRRRYGVIEPAVAERFGYHVPRRLLNPSDVSEMESEREKNLSPQEREAALDPDTGCAVKAYKRIIQGVEVDYDKFNELNGDAFNDAQKAPKVIQAIQDWSACMDSKGFDYSRPFEPGKDPRWWESETENASREEIATAQADVRCKERTDLVQIWFSEEKQLQEVMLRKHSGYFRELKDAKQRHLDAARAILERS